MSPQLQFFSVFKQKTLRKLWVLVFIGTLNLSYGQTVGQNTKGIQFSLGAVHHRLIDEGFTQRRLKRSGTSITTMLGYESVGVTTLFKVGLQYGTSDVTISSIEEEIKLYNLLIAVLYAKKVTDYRFLANETSLYLGPKLSLWNYLLNDKRETKNLASTFNYTLDISLTQLTKINEKSNLELNLTIPIFGLVKREASDAGSNPTLENDYENNIPSFFFANTKATFSSPLSRIRFNTRYSLAIGNKTDFTINYLFNYIDIDKSPKISLFDNGLLIGLLFKL